MPNGNWLAALPVKIFEGQNLVNKLMIANVDSIGQFLNNETHLLDLPIEENVNDVIIDDSTNIVMFGSRLKAFGQPCFGIPNCLNAFANRYGKNGQLHWARQFNLASPYGQEFKGGVFTKNDGGYLFFGLSGNNNYYVKTNYQGRLYGNDLVGDLFYDENENCLWDNQDQALWRGLIKATSISGQEYIQTIDTSGHFELNLPDGNYQVRLLTPHQQMGVWDTCAYTTTADLSLGDQILSLDSTGFRPNLFCPSMQVEIGGGLFRPCTDINFTVNYCNLGTSSAENAYIEIEMDPLFTFLSSSIPFSSQNGNIHSFPIGNVIPGQCGSFNLVYTLSCEALMGQAICAKAHIYPDSLCQLSSTNWDYSDLEVTAVCLGDSVQFKVRNKGIGNIAEASEFIVIEDHILFRQGQIKLPSGTDTLIVVPLPTGVTYYLRAMQRPGHPTGQIAAAGLDFCGVTTGQSTLLNYPLGDGSFTVGQHCDEVRTSFDPNDKRGFPLGFGDDHIIDRNQDLEYMIRFQNTGNDTAFTVVVRDTLPTIFLDLTSLRVGSSSHPYTWELGQNGVLAFRFDHILLPDSTTNEPASHGFVKFGIAQRANLDYGSQIENRAGIYFDYNAPVLTEWSIHRVDTIKIPVATTEPKAEIDGEHASFFSISPNPFSEKTLISVMENSLAFPLVLQITDLQGREMRRENVASEKFFLQRKGLLSGVYFLKMTDTEGKSGFGKLICD
jgi:uncharacterized repeat protein (TIGR01451 family)